MQSTILLILLVGLISANPNRYTEANIRLDPLPPAPADTTSNQIENNPQNLLGENKLPNGATVGRVELVDGRSATILAYSGILAKDTKLPSYMDITLRQITDGSKVVQAVLGRFGNIMDCDVSFDQSDISRFSDDFMTSQSKVKPKNLTFVSRNRFSDKQREMVNLSWLVQQCHRYQRDMYGQAARRQRNTPARNHHRSKRSLLWEGTKWCGKGNDASKYTSLGNNNNADRCCRLHDHCPYTIPGFQTKYGTFNYRFYTVSHCDCDYSFRTCLKTANSGTANMIGSIYFNMVRLPCFIFVPKKTCAKRTWWGKCEQYSPQYVADVQPSLDFNSHV